MTSNTPYDCIIIGAGHNSLTTAAYLGKAGRKVLVLEAQQTIGGLAAQEEFHPGYSTIGILHDAAEVREFVLKELNLSNFGLQAFDDPAPTFFPQTKDSGRGIFYHRDPKKFASEAPSEQDAQQYQRFRAFFDRVGGFIEQLWSSPPLDPFNTGLASLLKLGGTGLALRRLGKDDMRELLRIGPMCVADWLNEWFASDLLKAGIAAGAVLGEWTGPWSPGTNANLVLREVLARKRIHGGPAALAAALAACAKHHGVEIQTDVTVSRILSDNGRVKGVETTDGGLLQARAVISGLNPITTMLELLGTQSLPWKTQNRLRHFRCRGTLMKINLALSAPLRFACRPDTEFEFARTGSTLDDVERSFDAVKYGSFSERPILDICVPSMLHGACAPDGHSVVSILAGFAPYELNGGWDTNTKAAFADRVLAELERFAPGVSSAIVGSQILSPLELANRFHLPGGHLRHGEHALDQLLVRPIPECGHYATSVPGLYLCGAGSFPGGGISCAPGALAAKAVLAA